MSSNHIHINFTILSSGDNAWGSLYFSSYLNNYSAARIRLENLKVPGAKVGWIVRGYFGDRRNLKPYEEIIRTNFYYSPTNKPILFEHINGEGLDFTGLPYNNWNEQVSSVLLKYHTWNHYI
ncbi:hypothetical protein [Bacillus cereus]|uniref:hypothetical protein n=1 Tax=Bacillus cereus TaxID=1396 RepID=UPI003D98A65B